MPIAGPLPHFLKSVAFTGVRGGFVDVRETKELSADWARTCGGGPSAKEKRQRGEAELSRLLDTKTP
jgi:hypothetical protein